MTKNEAIQRAIALEADRDALRAVLEGIEASLGDGAMSFVMRRNIAALKRQHGIQEGGAK